MQNGKLLLGEGVLMHTYVNTEQEGKNILEMMEKMYK